MSSGMSGISEIKAESLKRMSMFYVQQLKVMRGACCNICIIKHRYYNFNEQNFSILIKIYPERILKREL